MGTHVNRVGGALVAVALACALAACAPLGGGSAGKPLDQLENLGAGTKADYQSRMDQASEGDKQKILAEANQVNAVVGAEMVLDDPSA